MLNKAKQDSLDWHFSHFFLLWKCVLITMEGAITTLFIALKQNWNDFTQINLNIGKYNDTSSRHRCFSKKAKSTTLHMVTVKCTMPVIGNNFLKLAHKSEPYFQGSNIVFCVDLIPVLFCYQKASAVLPDC